MKECTKCGVTKDLELFSNNSATPDGKYAHCKECQKQAYGEWNETTGRNNRLIRHFNITLEEYNDLLLAQSGRCAICGNKPKKQRLAIDHDHNCCKGKRSCGKCIRGLLCMFCNHRLLGAAHDSVEILEKAADYLRNPPAKDFFK